MRLDGRQRLDGTSPQPRPQSLNRLDGTIDAQVASFSLKPSPRWPLYCPGGGLYP